MEKENVNDKQEMEAEDSPPKNKPQNLITKIISNITIEPALFLTSFARSLSGVSYEQMLIEKTCKNDFDFNDTVCDNLVNIFEDENTLIQNEVNINNYLG